MPRRQPHRSARTTDPLLHSPLQQPARRSSILKLSNCSIGLRRRVSSMRTNLLPTIILNVSAFDSRVEHNRDDCSWQMNKQAMDHHSLRLKNPMESESNQRSSTLNRLPQHHPRTRTTILRLLLPKSSPRLATWPLLIPRCPKEKQPPAHLISLNLNENAERIFPHRKSREPRSPRTRSKSNRMFPLSRRHPSAIAQHLQRRPPSAMRAWYSI